MKEHETNVPRRNAGFSLLELIIVMFFASIILYTVSYAFITSARTGVSLNRRSGVTASLQNSIDKIVDELRVSEDVHIAGSDRVTVIIDGDDVTFYYDPNSKEILRNGAVIAPDVEGVTFTYLDANGNETGDTDEIRRVFVTIQGQKGSELLEIESSANMRKRQ